MEECSPRSDIETQGHRDTETQRPDDAEAKDNLGEKIKDDVADVHHLERKRKKK